MGEWDYLVKGSLDATVNAASLLNFLQLQKVRPVTLISPTAEFFLNFCHWSESN